MSTSTALVDAALVEDVLADSAVDLRSRQSALARRRWLTAPQWLARGADFVELTKPKIAILELVTVAVAAYMARWHALDVGTLCHALVGTTLVAGSASALNQWLERDRDAVMARTVERPLPASRLSPAEVFVFGAATGLTGLLYLLLLVNPLTAALGLLSWALYVLVYTPMKTRTPLNTAVGAVAGGLPVLMGWAAVDGPFGLAPAVLFAIVFLWQFPHFMAIAWIYRHQYAKAGMRMLSVVDPSGLRAGRQAVLAALALLPVNLLPAVVSFAGPWYFAVACALGLIQLSVAVRFAWRRDEPSARVLLRTSLIYLPLLFVMLVIGPLV